MGLICDGKDATCGYALHSINRSYIDAVPPCGFTLKFIFNIELKISPLFFFLDASQSSVRCSNRMVVLFQAYCLNMDEQFGGLFL